MSRPILLDLRAASPTIIRFTDTTFAKRLMGEQQQTGTMTMGRKRKMKPEKVRKPAPEVKAKRVAASIRRVRRRGQKPRVVAGTAAARALGIQ